MRAICQFFGVHPSVGSVAYTLKHCVSINVINTAIVLVLVDAIDISDINALPRYVIYTSVLRMNFNLYHYLCVCFYTGP